MGEKSRWQFSYIVSIFASVWSTGNEISFFTFPNAGGGVEKMTQRNIYDKWQVVWMEMKCAETLEISSVDTSSQIETQAK